MPDGSEVIMQKSHAATAELTSSIVSPNADCRQVSFHCFDTIGGTLAIDHEIGDGVYKQVESPVTVAASVLRNVVVPYRMDKCRARFTPASGSAGMCTIRVEES